MPVQAGIEVGELSIQRHVDLADDRLLGGRAVEANGPGELVFVDRLLNGQRRADRSRPECAVAAAVAGAAAEERLALPGHLLRQLRQGVVLGENADDRLA